MKFEPRTYQNIAIEHLLEQPRCNLWADPGMGKTACALTAVDVLKLQGSRFLPALALGPFRVARGVWTAEAKRWEHLADVRVKSVTGDAEERRCALKADADVFAMNYENIEWLVDKLGDAWPFRTVIADESTRLKGFRLRRGGKRAEALAKMVKHTGRWVNMTGTPAPNGLIDLWGQCWFLDGGERLGRTFTAFKDRWFDEHKYTKRITPKPFAHKQIHAALADVTLSLDSAYWLGVKKPHFNTISVELPPEARKLYKQMERELGVALGDHEVSAKTAADLSIKCLQMASGALYTGEDAFETVHDEKLDALAELFEEMSGNPLMVAYHWRHDLARLKKRFPFARQLQTQADEDKWNAGEIPMLLVHPASAGHGLNLQHGGHTLCFFSHWWALEEYEQVIERIGPTRQMQAGYNRTVMVHSIVAHDTVDEDVVERRLSKQSVQNLLRARFAK